MGRRVFAYRSAAQVATAFALCVSLWQAPRAGAQQTENPTTSPRSSATEVGAKGNTTTVTIKGKKAASRVDRQVYDVSKNPDSLTASAAETLGKVPGVSVDPSGNVTLRGQNVRIYLNGRPSLMLSGDNRAQALQAMPSSYLGSIEVISNPGSQYESGSSGPIINIVTKRKAPPGLFGSVTGRANSTGRGQTSIWSSYTNGNLNLSLYGSDYGSMTRSRRGSDLEAFSLPGVLSDKTLANSTSLSHDQGVFVGVNLENEVTPQDVLSSGLTYNHGIGDYKGYGNATTYDAINQAKEIHSSSSLGTYMYASQGLTFGFTHYGQKPDETLKIDGSFSSSQNQSASQNITTYLLSTIPVNIGSRLDTKARDGSAHSVTLSSDYNTPVGEDQLAIGAQINHDDNRSQILAFGPNSVGTPLTSQSILNNDFRYSQTVSAVYATFQRELTQSLTVLGGLRAETWNLDSEDANSQTRSHVTYAQINPSLFATYVLSSKRKLRFSYAHHQHRPNPSDLNPHLVYNSSTSVTLGNPNLRPQANDTIESAFEFQDDKLTYAVRSFYRRDDHLIVGTSVFIPDPQNAGNLVLQTMHENFSFQTADGVTANFNDHLNSKLTLSGDATLTFSATRNPEIAGAQLGTSLGGSLAMSYAFANKDQVFINYKMTGKSFYGQGFTNAFSVTSVQFKHSLTPKVDLVMEVNDLLRTSKTENVTTTS